MPRRSDAELLAQFAAGDRAAFDALVARHQDGVLRFCACFAGGDPAAVEDAAQDAWVAAFRSAGSFRGDSSFRTWLFGIARHACLRRLRRHAAAASLEDCGEESLRVPDGEPAPLELLERGERERLVRAAISRLPAGQRAALVLREWEDLSYEEIARALEVPVGTVRSRLHNGLLRLGAELRASMEDTSHGL